MIANHPICLPFLEYLCSNHLYLAQISGIDRLTDRFIHLSIINCFVQIIQTFIFALPVVLTGRKMAKNVIFGTSLTATVLKLRVWNFKYKAFEGFPRMVFFWFLISGREPLQKKFQRPDLKGIFWICRAKEILKDFTNIEKMWIWFSEIFTKIGHYLF